MTTNSDFERLTADNVGIGDRLVRLDEYQGGEWPHGDRPVTVSEVVPRAGSGPDAVELVQDDRSVWWDLPRFRRAGIVASDDAPDDALQPGDLVEHTRGGRIGEFVRYVGDANQWCDVRVSNIQSKRWLRAHTRKLTSLRREPEPDPNFVTVTAEIGLKVPAKSKYLPCDEGTAAWLRNAMKAALDNDDLRAMLVDNTGWDPDLIDESIMVTVHEMTTTA